MNTIEVLGLDFVNAGIVEAVEQAMRAMEERKSAYAVAADALLLQQARKNRRLMAAVENAELILPDGGAVIYSSYILGMPLRQKISAVDFASALMARMSESGMSVFIISAEAELAELAEERIKERYPGLKIAGGDDFYSSDIELIDAINETRPDLLLVCLGSPRQETWMYRNRKAVNTGLMLGFGRELKVLAGATPRAPKRWRDSGFEWFYWLIKEPRRILRMLKSSCLVLSAIWRRLVG